MLRGQVQDYKSMVMEGTMQQLNNGGAAEAWGVCSDGGGGAPWNGLMTAACLTPTAYGDAGIWGGRLGPHSALKKFFFPSCDLHVLHVVLTWSRTTIHT